MRDHAKEPDYIPGSCNIGSEEISRRYRIGYIGLALSILCVALIEACDVHKTWRLLICIPVAVSLSGLIQAMQRFCFAYGLRGVFSVKGRHDFKTIVDTEFLRKDRNMAIALVSKVIAGSILITTLYYLMP